MEYYPNPYFSASDLLHAIADLEQLTEEIKNQPLALTDRLGFSTNAKALTTFSNNIREIALCLDSMRTGMSYRTLAELSGYSVAEVKNLLKHKRPQ